MYFLRISIVTIQVLVGLTLSATAKHLNGRGVLDGAKLRCCVVHEPPIAFLNDRNYANFGVDGIIANYLSQMQGFLNWTCSSVKPYSDGNTTGFNNFIMMMEKCSEKGVIKNDPDYSVVSGRSLFFITTFDTLGWLSIFALVLLYAAIWMFGTVFERDQYQPLGTTANPIRRLANFLYYNPFSYRLRVSIQRIFSRMILMPEPEDFSPPNNSFLWLVKTVVTICGLFLVLAYEASMTASIVQESVTSEFQSGEDFQYCRIDPKDVCLPSGGSFETYWTKVLASEPCHGGNRPHFMNSYDAVFQAVNNRTCRFGILLESTVHATIYREHCGTILSSEKPIFTGGLAMVLPKDSVYTEAMSLATLNITGAATVPSLEEFYVRTGSCSPDLATSLPFQKLKLFFTIAFSTGFFFLTIVIVKWALDRRGSRTENHDQQQHRDLSRRQDHVLQLHRIGFQHSRLPHLRVHVTLPRDDLLRLSRGLRHPDNDDGRPIPLFHRDGYGTQRQLHPAYVTRKDTDDSVDRSTS